MGDIKIVPYHKGYAQGLAKMWNKSGENWGGTNSVVTAEEVIQENENGGNLAIYLAIDGDEVVGYCSFSEYRLDEGASYIPLLNVRPDYHGKKVGKKLMLKAVARAIESEWPRLDLFTWPGNTKAVPLYKKCGFFWEKRDDTTHLMNFIPTVLKTEAVKDYFKNIDWYEDSTREIEVKHDGLEEGDFQFYQYRWEKENQKLIMEFERKGRGLRAIETEDYSISARLDDQALVFGKTYKVHYDISNKSNRPLHIDLKGVDDKNITYNLDASVDVGTDAHFEGEFTVDPIKEEQSIWRTHPSVVTNLLINGKKAQFKIGVEPKFPIKALLNVPRNMKEKGQNKPCYLDLENSFNEEVDVLFTLPNRPFIDFEKNEFSIKLKAKERRSIPIHYSLTNFDFYNAMVTFKVVVAGQPVEFDKEIVGAFKGNKGRFYGETEKEWQVHNGKYVLRLGKFDSDLFVNHFNGGDFESLFMYPKIGMPYSLEFSKIKPKMVIGYEVEEAMELKAVYHSRDFKGLELITVSRLYDNGMVKRHLELRNIGEDPINKDLKVSQPIYHEMANTYLPYGDDVIKIDGTHGAGLDNWSAEALSERWLFAKGEKVTRGIYWPENCDISFVHWYMAMTFDIGPLQPKESIKTEPILLAWDTFDTWQAFRADILGEENPIRDKGEKQPFEWTINGGNPFIKDQLTMTVKDHKKVFFNGEIKFASSKDAFEMIERHFEKEESIRSLVLNLPQKPKEALDVLKLQVDFKDIEMMKKQLIFNVEDNVCERRAYERAGYNILAVNNGPITIEAAPGFSNGLIGLSYKGHEWLNTSFPKAGPKAWWNPWMGGINCQPKDFSLASIGEEKREAQFTTLKDNYGNQWEGIKVSMVIKKNETYKGLEIHHYFLMLPGVPVVCQMVELVQSTGRYFNEESFQVNMYINNNEPIEAGWFMKAKNLGYKYKCSGTEYDISSYHSIIYGGPLRKEHLRVYHTSSNPQFAYTGNKVNWHYRREPISSASGTRTWLPADYLLFSEEILEEDLLAPFKTIKFE